MRDASPGGLLIVNADDFGLRPDVTDAIVGCWNARRISSTTAMVHMADSVRAARLAGEQGIPVGLHLNLTTPYTAPDVPPDVAARQAAMVQFFALKRRRWLPAPRHQAAVAACIEDQLAEFLRLHGRAPTHVDGHEHIQSSPAVFLSPALRSVAALRLSHTFVRGDRPWPKRAVRATVNVAIRARFRTTARFLSLRDVHPALGGSGLQRLLDASRTPVEIMVHPAWADERDLLLSPQWAQLLDRCRLGSYEALAGDSAALRPPLNGT